MIHPKTLAQIYSRLDKLTPDTAGLWGRMSAKQMLGHLIDAIRMSLGEIKVKSRYKFPNYWMFLFAVYVLPVSLWKKELPTPKEINQLKIKGDPKLFEERVKEFKEIIERFNACDASLIQEHPWFGRLTKRETKDLLVKHIDHHFRQFGL